MATLTLCRASVIGQIWIDSQRVSRCREKPREKCVHADYLSQQYRTFPHREFLDWMDWIQPLSSKKLLQASDIPQAAEVRPLPNRSGTMIVSVGEAFDMKSPAHIEKMQRVEVRLVKLGLLPVIDLELM